MTRAFDRIRQAKQSGDFRALAEEIPYNRFLGFTVEEKDGELVGLMRFLPHLIGNPTLPALHGGTIGALLESTAIFQAVWQSETVFLPKTITITFDYLRPGRPADVHARALVTRQGRRVVNVRVEAWQDDPARPIATANALLLIQTEEE